MARPSTGQVIERTGKRGRAFALRFRAYGARQYVTLGSAEDGWDRQRAEDELKNVLADVRRGIWRPPETEQPAAPKEEPTFHGFASEWIAAREAEGLAPKTITDLRWSLTNHLLPYFGSEIRPSEIGPREVDAYKVAKARERQEIEAAHARRERLRERGLSANSINHTLSDLAQVLEDGRRVRSARAESGQRQAPTLEVDPT